MKDTVYAFHMVKERLARLRQVLEPMHVGVRPVGAKEEAELPVAALLRTDAGQVPASPLEAREEMILLQTSSPRQTEKILQALREAGVIIPLKAVLTPSNIRWTGEMLYAHLRAERQAAQPQKNS